MAAPQLGPRSDPAFVLIVEDEVLVRAALALELREQGLLVIEASNADDAWTYLTAGGHADLLFTDLQMPGSMNGIELARRVKAEFPSVAVILGSGNIEPPDLHEFGQFIQKPYSFHGVSALILETLGLKAP
jgi:two-component system, response regulator PdtaR